MIYLKSKNEIARLRKSAQLVGKTLAEVARHVKPGVQTRTLDEVAETFIRDHGGEPAFKGYRVGNKVYPASLCVSIDDEVVHGIPGERELTDDMLLSVDCGILLDDFYGDSAYTFAVGELSREKKDLVQVTIDSLYRGIEAAVEGNRIGDISCAVQQYCEERGYGVVRELVGHGIGREMHEDPQVPNFGDCGTGRRLKNGLTMCLEPMINQGGPDVSTDDDGWTVRTVDGSPSVHYEHMVVVRPDGAEILSTFEYIEEVIEAPYNEVVL